MNKEKYNVSFPQAPKRISNIEALKITIYAKQKNNNKWFIHCISYKNVQNQKLTMNCSSCSWTKFYQDWYLHRSTSHDNDQKQEL